jgi:ribonuclease P protein component
LRTARFRRSQRLRDGRDFAHVRARGERRTSEPFLVQWEARGLGESRLGLAVSRRVGSSVQRNRLKRQIREWFRHERHRFRRPVDLVVVPRAPATRLSSAQVAAALGALVAKRLA